MRLLYFIGGVYSSICTSYTFFSFFWAIIHIFKSVNRNSTNNRSIIIRKMWGIQICHILYFLIFFKNKIKSEFWLFNYFKNLNKLSQAEGEWHRYGNFAPIILIYYTFFRHHMQKRRPSEVFIQFFYKLSRNSYFSISYTSIPQNITTSQKNFKFEVFTIFFYFFQIEKGACEWGGRWLHVLKAAKKGVAILYEAHIAT